MTLRDARIEGARRATVLRYGGSLWVSGYWPDTTVSIELRPIRARNRVILLGPPVGGTRSIAVDLAATVGIEAFAAALADWIETPSLSVRRAERAWAEAAQQIAADRAGGCVEGVPA